ncbi:sugar phosphate isomerase/epimerase family protein [Shouchella lehensis]|uniref:Sugar phosphate isomerase/epimerase n=1 Tax=Shouchella lehensis TaxID=300825 RepID=A0A4Y7WFD2_9BACI|nr:sugar phosphate isomerase/epimerase [Shouchella lehensis]MBG9785052.1 xylose isomerase [Shouchella lehensis]RQW18754.1 sugar phosphate isomerase/epimerase [Bacillus sp. C1-1]TES46476.1 sugar phosphate isomerase/epimerase [Shouchella lehensis]
MKDKFAATLFTVRDELKSAGIGPVFKEIAEMGYAGIQLSGLPLGYDQDEVAYHLKKNGVATAGMHVSFDRLTNEFDLVRQEAKKYGTTDVFCPYLPESLQTESGYREVKMTLNGLAKAAPELRIGYHNHAFEFETQLEGMDALAYLLEPREDNAIFAEIDVFWVAKGGHDPLSYVEPYKGRMPVIHLKDMTADEDRTFAEVGEGIIDFPPLLQWGERHGIEWYVVEQDVCKGAPMDSLRMSLSNLHRFADALQEQKQKK